MNKAANLYLQTKVETASPGQLIYFLYESLVTHLAGAEKDILQKKFESSHQHFIHCQRILEELTKSLNPAAGDMADNLLNLYVFMSNELVEVNLRKDVGRLRPVIDMMMQLRDAWYQGVVLGRANPVRVAA